jgi:hypothetical protein
VISLSIDRSSIGLLPLTVADTGTTGAVIVAWQPKSKDRDNTVARSRWLSGGSLVSTRDEIVGMTLAVQLWATTPALLDQAVDTWDAALGQFAYQITETTTGALTPKVYDCQPASWSVDNDPVMIRAGLVILTASIPRQP